MNETPREDLSQEEDQPDDACEPPESGDVSPFIEAFRMLSHITTALCLMMICGATGYAIDYYLEIKGVALIGFFLGGTLAIRHLIAATSQTP